jgi:dihydropteroate synthase
VTPRPRLILRARSLSIPLGDRTRVMAILNCTPDSFSDGGAHLSAADAVARLHALVEEGADLVDVGGESTRPGAEPVPWEEEWRRVEPVFREIARGYPLPISIDTTKLQVARRALDHGAAIVNDVSGLSAEPRLGPLAADTGAALVLMHRKGTPGTMQVDPTYDDVTAEVAASLAESAHRARDAGVAADHVVIDPGIGFGKTAEPNFTLLRELPELGRLGNPIRVLPRTASRPRSPPTSLPPSPVPTWSASMTSGPPCAPSPSRTRSSPPAPAGTAETAGWARPGGPTAPFWPFLRRRSIPTVA